MEIQAVIFDMDGLLLDTETLGVEACLAVGEKQGLNITPQVVLQTLGMTQETSNRIYKDHDERFEPARFWAGFDEWIKHSVSIKAPDKKAFAEELLMILKQKGIRCGLCSSSPRERVMLYLGASGLLPYFDEFVTGCDGAASKPSPDMYLLAAKKLGLMPEHCMVLEDSPNGLRAGHAAGMHTYMVPDLIPYTEELAAHCEGVLTDLSQVLPLLGYAHAD